MGSSSTLVDSLAKHKQIGLAKQPSRPSSFSRSPAPRSSPSPSRSSTMSSTVSSSLSSSTMSSSSLVLDPLRGHVVLERLREKKRGSSWRQFPEELARSAKAALMEAQRSSALPTTTATAQALNLTLEERQGLRLCLDALQERIPVKTASDLACRLQALATRTGLKYSATLAHGCYYLSNEMFYVEIASEADDKQSGLVQVQEVRIHHIDATKTILHQEAKNCSEIVSCLRNNDFKSFQLHLEALIEIYSLEDATAIEKSQAWMALNVLETDVNALNEYLMKRAINADNSLSSNEEVVNVINRSPLGLFECRRGGLPSRIVFLLPPSHLIKDKNWVKCDKEIILKENLGIWGQICIESDVEKRNILPIASVVRYDANSDHNLVLEDALPSNSLQLPARFALRLGQPLVLSIDSCEQIEELTSENLKGKDPKDFMRLLAPLANPKSTFVVNLPGECHGYVFRSEKYGGATLTTSIAFTHLDCLVDVIDVLRKQALFNTLISSCLIESSIKGVVNVPPELPIFEVTFQDINHITVCFVMMLLKGRSCLCSVHIRLLPKADLAVTVDLSVELDTQEKSLLCPIIKANSALKKTLSIPVLMRTLLTHARRQRKLLQIALEKQERKRHEAVAATVKQANIKQECRSPSIPPQADNEKSNSNASNGEKSKKLGGGDDALMTTETLKIKMEPTESKDKMNPLIENAKRSEKGDFPNVGDLQKQSSKRSERDESNSKSSLRKSSPSRLNFGSDTTFSKSKLESRLHSAKSSGFSDIKPSVSITPVSSVQPTQSHLSMGSKDSSRSSSTLSSTNLGIEIIPLNRNPNSSRSSGSGSSSTSVGLKRSFSEDYDGSSSTKGQKRKHPSSDEATTSNFGKLLEKISASGTPMVLGSEGIEVSVATSETASPASKSLKLTLKTPSRGSSPTSSSKKSSSSGSRHHSSSSSGSSSSSKSHHHSSRHGSPKKDSKKDRRKGSSSSSHHGHHYHHHSSSGSHKSSSSGRSRDEAHISSSKLSKPFQIPKLSRSKSPSPKHSFSSGSQSSSKQWTSNVGSSSSEQQSQPPQGSSSSASSSTPKTSESSEKRD